jgi:hypothetical protein
VDAIVKGGFKVLNSRYYFNNISYINISFLLTLFRRTRYYLYKVIIAKAPFKTFKEFFNLRHLTLKNKVKRIFNILKRRFLFL